MCPRMCVSAYHKANMAWIQWWRGINMKLEQNLMWNNINEWPFMVEIKFFCSFPLYLYSCLNLSYSLKGKFQVKHALEAIFKFSFHCQPLRCGNFFRNSELKTKWVSKTLIKLFKMHPNRIFKNRKKHPLFLT